MGVYLEARTVQELADKCGYGLKTFQRLFTVVFGSTQQMVDETKSTTRKSATIG